MWGTDATSAWTRLEGTATLFVAVDHDAPDCVGIHAVRLGTWFEALEPIYQDLRAHFGALERGVAKGLTLHHDNGLAYISLSDLKGRLLVSGHNDDSPNGNKGQVLWVGDNAIGSPFDDTIIGNSDDNFLFGVRGQDLIWGDAPGVTEVDPDNFGDDTLTGGLGKNALILGTEKQDIQLGGQDIVGIQRGHQGEDAVFNFNIGPIDRYDDINAPHGVDVDPNEEDGADLTFDIASFRGYAGVNDLVSHATVYFGNEDEEAIEILGEVSGKDFSGVDLGSADRDAGTIADPNNNTFDTGEGTVYAGNNGPDVAFDPSNGNSDSGDFEIKLNLDQGGSVIFANAASKWFKHFLRGELDDDFDALAELDTDPSSDGLEESPDNLALNQWFNDNLANGNPTESLVELSDSEAAGLVGLLNDGDLYGNFQFEG